MVQQSINLQRTHATDFFNCCKFIFYPILILNTALKCKFYSLQHIRLSRVLILNICLLYIENTLNFRVLPFFERDCK